MGWIWSSAQTTASFIDLAIAGLPARQTTETTTEIVGVGYALTHLHDTNWSQARVKPHGVRTLLSRVTAGRSFLDFQAFRSVDHVSTLETRDAVRVLTLKAATGSGSLESLFEDLMGFANLSTEQQQQAWKATSFSWPEAHVSFTLISKTQLVVRTESGR